MGLGVPRFIDQILAKDPTLSDKLTKCLREQEEILQQREIAAIYRNRLIPILEEVTGYKDRQLGAAFNLVKEKLDQNLFTKLNDEEIKDYIQKALII